MPDILPVGLQNELWYSKSGLWKQRRKTELTFVRVYAAFDNNKTIMPPFRAAFLAWGDFYMIHQYKFDDLNIVLDICSGAVHVVDELAYDIISMFENNDKSDIIDKMSAKYPDIPVSDIEECYCQVCELAEDNKLFTKDEFKMMPAGDKIVKFLEKLKIY